MISVIELRGRSKCFTQAGARCTNCKYGFPRPRHTSSIPEKDIETNRYMYKCEECEDERLSPYVPEWLLAWGANMNVQLCDAALFLSYISKCAARCPWVACDFPCGSYHISRRVACGPFWGCMWRPVRVLHTSLAWRVLKFTGVGAACWVCGPGAVIQSSQLKCKSTR